MQKRKLFDFRRIRLCVSLTVLLLLSPVEGPHATEIAEPAIPLGVENKITSPASSELYSYEMEGRSDPFIPFISTKATTTGTRLDPNEIIDEGNIVLTGMQLFEPGQLTLVAILNTELSSIAMVEDVTGKGYVLREGIPIGRRGIVSNISPTTVNITETAKTRAGKKIKSTITMKLKNEGDE